MRDHQPWSTICVPSAKHRHRLQVFVQQQRGIIRNKRNIGRRCWRLEVVKVVTVQSVFMFGAHGRGQQSSRLLLLCGIGFVDETLSLHLIGIEVRNVAAITTASQGSRTGVART